MSCTSFQVGKGRELTLVMEMKILSSLTVLIMSRLFAAIAAEQKWRRWSHDEAPFLIIFDIDRVVLRARMAAPL